MERALTKVLIINTADTGGGAERVSMAVLDGFLELGLDAWLLVGSKAGDHARVVPFHASPFFDYRAHNVASTWEATERRRHLDVSAGLEDFNYPYSHYVSELTGSAPDLVLCHNLHGGYFDLRAIRSLSARMPVALRLFDTWLQAGHCAYSLGCDRWLAGCGQCPDLTIEPAISRDGSHLNVLRKKAIFQASRVFFSAETRWMLDRAKRSLLAPAALCWKHIPGGVDLRTFSPGSRVEARRQLGLDPNGELLLYVANGGASNQYKDFATVRRAVERLRTAEPTRRLTLLVVGSSGPEHEVIPGIDIRQVGYVASRSRLATFYRAADIVVHSAIEETFGNVVAEAMACGTPVVAASSGGVVELIDHGRTGLVLPPRHPDRLADALSELLRASRLRAEMGAAAAAAARRRFDSRIMIRNLYSWCSEIHSAWHARAAT